MNQLALLPLTLGDVPPGLVQALGQEGVPFVHRGGDVGNARFVLFDSQREKPPALSFGQQAIDVDTLRRGESSDPFELLVDERTTLAEWRVGSLEPREEIARVNKRSVRRRLMARLRHELERRGGIWLTVAAFPFPYRGAVNFRIDYDDFAADDFAATLDAVRGHEDATSHFVCGADFDGRKEALARLRGLDVGSHGYWHHTYRDAEENRRNILRGIAVLRAAGIEPSGFVAPHGRFNGGLLAVLEELEISHSSEFALAYDDVPFFPSGSKVLQIPVHPVCLGVILEAARSSAFHAGGHGHVPEQVAELATRYFTAVTEAKCGSGEPAFFYCHPTGRLGRYPAVLTSVFETARNFPAVWRTTFTRFADWWRQRASVALRVVAADDGYTVMVERGAERFCPALEVWQPHGVAVLPLERPVLRFSPQTLHYEPRRELLLPAPPMPVSRARSPRAALRRFVDWEKATPLADLSVHSVRSLLKKTLRYVKR